MGSLYGEQESTKTEALIGTGAQTYWEKIYTEKAPDAVRVPGSTVVSVLEDNARTATFLDSFHHRNLPATNFLE